MVGFELFSNNRTVELVVAERQLFHVAEKSEL